jgi:hypothetical protein
MDNEKDLRWKILKEQDDQTLRDIVRFKDSKVYQVFKRAKDSLRLNLSGILFGIEDEHVDKINLNLIHNLRGQWLAAAMFDTMINRAEREIKTRDRLQEQKDAKIGVTNG